jgi:hypothetical protein
LSSLNAVLFLIWVASVAGSAMVASSKNRSAGVWAVLGFLFGVFALIVVAVLPRKQPAW